MTRQEYRFKERWDSILDGAHNTVRVLLQDDSDIAKINACSDSWSLIETARWEALASKAAV